MSVSDINPGQRLADTGTLLYRNQQVPLTEPEWSKLEQLLNRVEYDHVVSGDSNESHSVHVARFVNDVRRPESLNDLTADVKHIVMSDKMLQFYSNFTGTDILCLRRCQANLLMVGDYIGRHKDQDSNPDYVATVVFHFDHGYEGGAFVTHHPDYGESSYRPEARTVLVNNCEIPHEVETITGGRRQTLACFLSREFGPSPVDRQAFKLSN